MCVTITQLVGYSVPEKKVMAAKRAKGEASIWKDLPSKGLWGKDVEVFYVHFQDSICECGDSEGNGRKFERDAFEALVIDEDDENLLEIGKQRDILKGKLEKVGLMKYATWGNFVDAYADPH